MQENRTVVPVAMMEAMFNSNHAAGLIPGRDTHLPAFHFVGEIVPHTQEVAWIRDIVVGFLPPDYKGNTIEEIPKMVADSIKNGYVTPKSGNKQPSAAETGLNLVRGPEITLFHTEQNVGFIAVTSSEHGTVCHPIRSGATKGFILLRYYHNTGKTISKEAISEIIDLMDAEAIYDSPEEKVHVRIAGKGGAVYYDLGRPDGAVVEITSAGWTLVHNPPVYFYRPDGFAAQVAPEGGGNLDDLRALLQLDEKNWVLFLAYLIVSLKPIFPYMALLVSGGYGSGKSKVSELIKRIIDPNAIEKQRLPKDEHTLAIQAAMSRMLVYDNASSVRWDISDFLCAMLTGGGFSTRKYYTDDEQRMFKNSVPVIINGIGEFASQHDLLDRSIVLSLPTIPEGARRTEKAINARFEEILPGILGRLFDIASTAMRRFDEVEPPTTVRMADSAQWLIAAEPETGLPVGTFLRALEASVKEAKIESTINHPLVRKVVEILDLMGAKRSYEGTVGELHDKLRDNYGRIEQSLPQTPSHLSNALQRLAPGMAAIGIMVELQPRTNRARPLRIWVEETEYTPEQDPMLKKLG
ncbi:hypothetical protein GOD82_04175 [Sinorhizobium medicae]|nr:hypothetical protein [Sinorhizobium medicae]